MGPWIQQLLPFLREVPVAPLYFMHIPKTAGTTVDHLLRRRFARNRVNRTFNVIELMRMPSRKLASFDFLSGHLEFGFYLEQLLGRPVRTLAFVRQPRPLLLSIFKQVVKEKRDPLHDYVQRTCPDIERFFHDPVMSNYVANFQTRYLAVAERRFDVATVETIRRCPDKDVNGVLRDAAAREQSHTLPDSVLLQRALERIGQCWFVGLTERLDESMGKLAAKLGWKPFHAAPQLNQSPHGARAADLSKSVLTRIDELTALDRILYDNAARLYLESDVRAAA